MESETFENTFRSFMQRRPFQPFTVAMVNGDRLEVDFPNALAFRDGVASYIAAGGLPVWFDHEGVSQIIGDLAGQSPV